MARSLFLVAAVVALLSGCAPTAVLTGTPNSTSSSTPIAASPTAGVAAPDVGATQGWIEVDLATQMVRLREGDKIMAEFLASTGVAISPETTTYPGVYQVQEMIKGPIENVPGVFVSDILIYDQAVGAGIHSMPMDKAGAVLDSTLGRPATAGCVRVEDSTAVFDFARLGTTIWIH